MSKQHLSWRHLSMSGISQLLLTRFQPNFKCRFFGPSVTGDICPGNICPGDISTYKQYLSYYWSNFDQHFVDPNSWGTFCRTHFMFTKLLLTKTFFGRKIIFLPKFFFGLDFLDLKSFVPKKFWIQNFWTQNFFGQKICLQPKCFASKLNQNLCRTKIFWAQNEVEIFYLNPQTKIHLGMEFDSSVGPTCHFIFSP